MNKNIIIQQSYSVDSKEKKAILLYLKSMWENRPMDM